MHAEVECPCGYRFKVRLAEAGGVRRCRCQRTLRIPVLTALVRAANAAQAAPADFLPEDTDSRHSVLEAPPAFDTQQPETPLATVAHGDETETDGPREFVFLLSSDEDRHQRISHEALLHLLQAVLRELNAFARDRTGEGVDVQVAFAALPGGKSLIEIQSSKCQGERELKEALHARLASLAVPDVVDGPVAFAVRHRLWGGADLARHPLDFSFPFVPSFAGQAGRLEDLLMGAHLARAIDDHVTLAAAGAPPGPAPQAWWRRAWRALLDFLRSPLGKPRVISSTPFFSGEPDGPIASEDAPELEPDDLSIERLDQLLGEPSPRPVYYGIRGELWKRNGDLERASADFSRLIELEPENARARSARGHCQLQMGSRQNALVDFTKALALDPDQQDARCSRAAIYLDLEAWDQALADFSALGDSRAARLPLVHIGTGRALLAKQQAAQAVLSFDRALKLDPHHDEAYAWRSRARRLLVSDGPLAKAELEPVLRDMTAAIHIDPDWPGYYLERAQVHLTRQQFNEALADCDQAIRLNPEFAEAFALRGVACQYLARWQQAIDDSTRAMSGGVRSFITRLTRAVAYHEIQEEDLALEECNASLELNPNHAPTHNLRGLLNLQRSALPEAIEDFTAAIRLAPEWAQPRVNRANAHRAQRNSTQAIADYDAALDLDAADGIAWLNRGLCYIDQGELETAMRNFNEGLTRLPDYAPGFLGRAMARAKAEQFDLALADLGRAIELDRTFAPAYFQRAMLNLHAQRHDEALADLDRVVELCPTLAAAYSARGNAWIEKGEFEKATADYQEAIQCDPSAAENYQMQQWMVEAAYHLRHERFQDAVRVADAALDQVPESAPARAMRAVANWYCEEFVDAIDDYTRLIEMDGKTHASLNGRGQVHAEMGRFEDALLDLNRAIELGIEEGVTRTHLAYAYSARALAHAGLGEYELAFQDFERSIRDCPENAWVHYNHGRAYHALGEQAKAALCFELALQLNDPPLTPRKRSRARAYLNRHPPSDPPAATPPLAE